MIIFLVVSVVLWGALHVLLRSHPPEGTVMISHRGMAGSAPENTLAAIDEAIRRGAQFVEIDVRRSADGVIVLMHDQMVDRTTNGHGRVGELAWDEISTLDAGSHFSPAFAGEPVPTLDDVLTLLQRSSITLVLEVKQPDRYPGIALQVAEKLQKFDLNTRVVVVSFDHDWLDDLRNLMPDVPVGYLQVGGRIRRQMPGDSLLDLHWISVLVDPTLIWRTHRRGHRIWVWTVNDVRLARLLTWLGVDGITTNHPDKVQGSQGVGDAGPVH
jgi:glycerophosphoryl diester phosphodiesterase